MINEQLLKVLSQNDFICEWDLAKKLSKKPDTVYGGIKSDLADMEKDGVAFRVGQKFVDQHGKLFDVWTSKQGAIEQRKASYELKSKNQLISNLINTLYTEFKQHNTVQPLVDCSNLIADGKGKISLEYHLLSRAEVISIYQKVIAKSPYWAAEEAKYYKQPAYTSSGTVKKWKIPND